MQSSLLLQTNMKVTLTFWKLFQNTFKLYIPSSNHSSELRFISPRFTWHCTTSHST